MASTAMQFINHKSSPVNALKQNKLAKSSKRILSQFFRTLSAGFYNTLNNQNLLGPRTAPLPEAVVIRSKINAVQAHPVDYVKTYSDLEVFSINNAVREMLGSEVSAPKIDSYCYSGFSVAHTLSYDISDDMAKLYAYHVAFICAFRNNQFLRKLMQFPFMYPTAPDGLIQHLNEQNCLSSTSGDNDTYSGPGSALFRQGFLNMNLNTERGVRNVSSLANISQVLNNGNVMAREHIAAIQTAGMDQGYFPLKITQPGNNVGSTRDYLNYYIMWMMRLICMITPSSELSTGLKKHHMGLAFTEMLDSELSIQPIQMSMASILSRFTSHEARMYGQSFNTATRQAGFVKDLYSLSDSLSTDIFSMPVTTGLINRQFAKSPLGFAKDGDALNVAKEIITSKIANNQIVSSIGAGSNAQKLKAIRAMIEIAATNIGSIDGCYMAPRPNDSNSNYFVDQLSRPYLNILDTCLSVVNTGYPSISNNAPLAPNFYISTKDLPSYIKTQKAFTGKLGQEVSAVNTTDPTADYKAIDPAMPCSLFRAIFMANKPSDILGFDVAPIPTDKDVEKIAKYLQQNCKFTVNATSTAVSPQLFSSMYIDSRLDTNKSTDGIFNAFKSTVGSLVCIGMLSHNSTKQLESFKKLLYPLSIVPLTKSVIASKYKTFQTIFGSTTRVVNR